MRTRGRWFLSLSVCNTSVFSPLSLRPRETRPAPCTLHLTRPHFSTTILRRHFSSYLKYRGKLKKRKSYCRKSLHQMHTKGNAQREVVQHTLCLSGQLLLHVKCEVSVWVKHGAESPFFDVHTQIQAFWDFWVSHKTASGHLHKHVHKVEVSQFYYTVAKLRGWGTPVVSHIMDFIHGGQGWVQMLKFALSLFFFVFWWTSDSYVCG